MKNEFLPFSNVNKRPMGGTSRFFTLAKAFISITAALVLVAITSISPRAESPPTVKIIPEKDLQTDAKTGAGAFAWSEDSKAIAYVKWLSGHVGIIDIETDEQHEIPNFQMNGATALAWSQNGEMIALSSGTELYIVRISDGQVVGYYAAYKDPANPRIGTTMAFADNDAKLLIETGGFGKFSRVGGHKPDGTSFPQPTKDGDILLLAYDIPKKTINPFFSSPYNNDLKRESRFPNSGRFYRYNHDLYYSYLWSREREHEIDPPNIDFSKNYNGMPFPNHLLTVNNPATCVVVKFNNKTTAPEIRMRLFPPPGQETLDGSRDISYCGYSPASDRIFIINNYPVKWDEGPKLHHPLKHNTYQTLKFEDISNLIAFDAPPLSVSPDMIPLGINNTKPWTLFLSDPSADGRYYLMLGDNTTGKLIGQTDEETHDRVGRIIMSPDGIHVAFETYNNKLSLYKFTSSEPK